MSRKPDPARRSALLDQVSAYVEQHGVAGLSLRPLGKALGVSPRTLLYYFGSKEHLIAEVISARRARQQRAFERIQETGSDADPIGTCRAIWQSMSSSDGVAAFRRFIETYAYALEAPDRYEGFLESTIADWLGINASRERATMIIAGFRGFMLDLCATGDHERVDRAVEHWLTMLEKDLETQEHPHV